MGSDCILVSLDLALVTVISTDKPELHSKLFTMFFKAHSRLAILLALYDWLHSDVSETCFRGFAEISSRCFGRMTVQYLLFAIWFLLWWHANYFLCWTLKCIISISLDRDFLFKICTEIIFKSCFYASVHIFFYSLILNKRVIILNDALNPLVIQIRIERDFQKA